MKWEKWDKTIAYVISMSNSQGDSAGQMPIEKKMKYRYLPCT